MDERLVEAFVPSEIKSPGRRLWILPPARGDAQSLFVFLDAELYLERVGARTLIDQLHVEDKVPPSLAVFVAANDSASRHADFVCDPAYARFLSDDVLPFVRARMKSGPVRVVLVGLSLSGLAVAHAAVLTKRFDAVVCQSPSCWWEHERFSDSLPPAAENPPALWISVGDLETESGVSHPPSGLYQGTSQRESCTRAAAALVNVGYHVRYREFHGGHDPACWREDLAMALPWTTSQRR